MNFTLNRINRIGCTIAYFGIFLILFWIGIFKFTPTEADAIKPLVENHPLMFWLYKVLSVQGVSCLIGLVEIITAILIVMAIKWKWAHKAAAILIIFTFLTTLSFLLTTPNVWRIVDGVPVTEFFILKDLPMLGLGLILLGKSNKEC